MVRLAAAGAEAVQRSWDRSRDRMAFVVRMRTPRATSSSGSSWHASSAERPVLALHLVQLDLH